MVKLGSDELNVSVEQAISLAQDSELPRKMLHGAIAPLTIGLYMSGIQISAVTPVLVKALVPIVVCEILRNISSNFNSAYIAVVGPLMRESEKKGRINGVIYYLLGLIIVFSLFPKDLSMLSVLLLSWADLAASSVGRAYGKYTLQLANGKSLAGSLGAFLVGSLCCYVLYAYLLPAYSHLNTFDDLAWHSEHSRMSLLVYSIVAGAAAAAAELYPVLDDNLSIPVVSTIVLAIIIRATAQ